MIKQKFYCVVYFNGLVTPGATGVTMSFRKAALIGLSQFITGHRPRVHKYTYY